MLRKQLTMDDSTKKLKYHLATGLLLCCQNGSYCRFIYATLQNIASVAAAVLRIILITKRC